MTKNALPSSWAWEKPTPARLGTSGTLNSWEPNGIAANEPLLGYIGVPDPGWGYSETAPARPSPWTSEQAGFYYVDNDTGTDSGRTYGDPTAPRATIPNPIPAGSRVELHGNYDAIIGGAIKINGAGTEANPVWVVGVDGDRPVITGAVNVILGSWMFIEKINWLQTSLNYTLLQIGSGAPGNSWDHIMVRDGDVGGWLGGGIGSSIIKRAGETGNNCIFHELTLHDFNDITNPLDIDTTCISMTDNLTDVWILECNISNSAGSGVQIATTSGSRQNAQRIFVAKNNIDSVRQSGLWVKNGKDIVFSQNTINNVINTAWSPSKAMGGQYYVEGVWYIFNTVTNCRYGLRIPGLSGGANGEAYAIGNTFDDMGQGFSTGASTWDTAAIHIHGGTGGIFHLIDNTIYNSVSGIHLSGASVYTDMVISGNIISEITDAAGHHFWCERTDQNDAVLTKNQFYDTTAISMKNGGTGTVYTTIAAWQAATSNSVGDQFGDPLFTNAGTSDFTLQAGSPCLNNSDEDLAYALFTTIFELAIKVDHAANDRPVTPGNWDRGAFERAV